MSSDSGRMKKNGNLMAFWPGIWFKPLNKFIHGPFEVRILQHH
jgi:hypothetical protein